MSMVLHYQQRILPRLLSISSSCSSSFQFHLSFPSRFFSISSSSSVAAATKSHLVALPKQLQLDTPLRPPIPNETLVEIPLDKLFVPPEVELAAAATSVARGRILKGSNIVLGSYSRDAQVSTAEFVKSSTCTEDCPAGSLPDFALVGRSNVGKSSLLNSLVRRKRLALISKKPGKTQCINHFRINDSWYLVDLPGYGYASAPQKLRTNWDGFTKEYFLKRETLVCVFLLIDVSIPPKKIDLEYARWLNQNQIPMTLIFTKCDKRKKKKNGVKMPEENAEDFLNLISEYFQAPPPWIMASSVTNMGRDEILLHIAQLRNYWLKH